MLCPCRESVLNLEHPLSEISLHIMNFLFLVNKQPYSCFRFSINLLLVFVQCHVSKCVVYGYKSIMMNGLYKLQLSVYKYELNVVCMRITNSLIVRQWQGSQ